MIHGTILGSITLVTWIVTVFSLTPSYGAYYYPQSILGPFLLIGSAYAILFALIGGINQVLSEKLWDIKCEQNIGNGMRDGAILLFVFNITFIPINIMAIAYSFSPWSGLNNIQVILILLVSVFVSVYAIGFLSEKIASFLYVDKDPETPPDFSKHSYTCPHCNARYYYGSEIPNNGTITCQNCARDFPIN
ncbi:hypothetical protein EU528_14245 [Candidatus Thorarchaeota archaeon]|nr:MAG: hypothetical protein EU528_14245 [Candidatus Thorarchaeota archaeon]